MTKTIETPTFGMKEHTMSIGMEDRIKALCEQLEINEDRSQVMIDYIKELLEMNKYINLTSIRDYETALSVHLEDSLYGYEYVKSAPDGLYGDLGSGCGVPGILLGIATGRNTRLIDSTGKKMNAVSSILKKLNLAESIATETTRIEDYALKAPNAFDVLTARALDKLSVVMELGAPLLKTGGRLVQFKGIPEDGELDHAVEVGKILGFEEIARDTFELTHEGMKRTIVVYEKVAEPSIKLPRRNGVAHKKPL